MTGIERAAGATDRSRPRAPCWSCSPARPGIFDEEQAGLQRVGHDELCVTNGEVTTGAGRFAIDTPSSRAVVRRMSAAAADQVAQIRFRYLGPSTADKPLASGQLRHPDRIEARGREHLQPHLRHVAHRAGCPSRCGSSAIPACTCTASAAPAATFSVKAPSRVEPPLIQQGETHTLRAALRGQELTVVADDKPAWHAMLDGRCRRPGRISHRQRAGPARICSRRKRGRRLGASCFIRALEMQSRGGRISVVQRVRPEVAGPMTSYNG